jgi:hypothetical protein
VLSVRPVGGESFRAKIVVFRDGFWRILSASRFSAQEVHCLFLKSRKMRMLPKTFLARLSDILEFLGWGRTGRSECYYRQRDELLYDSERSQGELRQVRETPDFIERSQEESWTCVG